MVMRKEIHIALLLLASLCISGCETPSTESNAFNSDFDDFFADEPKDSLDEFNRAMMELNLFLDAYILEPAAIAYKALTPQIIQTGVGNFTRNIKTPFYLLNDLFQWRLDCFGHNLWVFTINTVGGFGGVMNTAGYMDVYAKTNDFGITLHRWGLGAGASITLPILGPTCMRDVVGSAAGLFLDPVGAAAWYYDYRWTNYTVISVGFVHERSLFLGQLDSLLKETYDPYITLKSIAEQKREAEIKEHE